MSELPTPRSDKASFYADRYDTITGDPLRVACVLLDTARALERKLDAALVDVFNLRKAGNKMELDVICMLSLLQTLSRSLQKPVQATNWTAYNDLNKSLAQWGGGR
jgi:hypothetical protein